MHNEDGSVVITVNGEIYNHVELRKNLEARGHHFRSHTDIEVVAHLWEEYGDKTPAMLRGMFALAVWDRKKRELLLARDRLRREADLLDVRLAWPRVGLRDQRPARAAARRSRHRHGGAR